MADRALVTTGLGPALDRLYTSFNYADSATDPIQIVRRFDRADDREVVAFCAAALAFGRVTSVLQSIERVLTVMGRQPARYVRAFDPRREARKFEPIVHRWIRGVDLVALVWLMKQMTDEAETIEGFFLEGHASDAEDVGPALDSFSRRALALDLTAADGRRIPKRAGVGYFFSRPRRAARASDSNPCSCGGWRRDSLDLACRTRCAAANSSCRSTRT
jgi:hypothetical protein